MRRTDSKLLRTNCAEHRQSFMPSSNKFLTSPRRSSGQTEGDRQMQTGMLLTELLAIPTELGQGLRSALQQSLESQPEKKIAFKSLAMSPRGRLSIVVGFSGVLIYVLFVSFSVCVLVPVHLLQRKDVPCRFRGCKNRPAPFPGQMYKATKPGYFCFISQHVLLRCCLLGPLFISQCRTAVLHCCKGDAASQWDMAILGVSELRNP